MQRRHPNVVRGRGSDALGRGSVALSGGSIDQSEGARMQPMAKARAAPAEATESRRAGTAKVALDEGPKSRGTS